MKRVVDAQQQEIKIVLEISQQDNLGRRISFELDTSRGNAKELTADVLRERMVLMNKHHCDLVISLTEAGTLLEESKQNNRKDNAGSETQELMEVVRAELGRNKSKQFEKRELHQGPDGPDSSKRQVPERALGSARGRLRKMMSSPFPCKRAKRDVEI